MNKEYYVLENGEKTGPFSFNELIAKDINIHTEIITPLSDEPQYASELMELNAYFESKGIYFPTQDNLANFGRRAMAFIIDYISLYFIIEAVEMRMGWIVLPPELKFGMPIPYSIWVLYISFFIAFLLYKTIFEATNLKGTIGKRICRLNVVDINGEGIGPLKSLGRNLGVLLSLTIWVPFLSMLFSEYRQTWYDSIAKTYVITTA
jgi:uncharacterized RDD family membrane protein YckC